MIVSFIGVTRFILQNNWKVGGAPKTNNVYCIVQQDILIKKMQNFDINNFYFVVQRRLGTSLSKFKTKPFLHLWTKELSQIPLLLKNHSVNIAKHCLKQVEFVIAQRIRRGQQMVTLYTRIWDDKAMKHLFLLMKRAMHKKGRQLMLGASLLVFDWPNERISVDELLRHLNEMNFCNALRNNSTSVEMTDEEGCPDESCKCPNCNIKVECWEPFVAEQDLMVWKMEESKGSGLYCYKMYGKYTDVTANDFLEVYLDTDHRKEWDAHAADLKIIESEPSSNSDVIYWETKWPALFANRDYVFTRRYYKNEERNIIIIMNKSTEHPLCPSTWSKARVKEYWSYMVIQSKGGFDKPGIEFSLTYFDNPGISIPSAILLWVTVSGMPEYLKRLRLEALAISSKRTKTTNVKEDDIDNIEEKDVGKNKKKSPSPETPPRPPPDHDSPLSDVDIFYIFGTYMQKLKTSLWL